MAKQIEEKDPLLHVTGTEDTETIVEKSEEKFTKSTMECVENCADDGRVSYILPRNILSNDKHHTVIVNGKAYQVEVGVRVNIPKEVAEVLESAVTMRLSLQNKQNELSKN